MSISKQVKERLSKMSPGLVFGLAEFADLGNLQAVALELSRLSKKGVIERLSKGKYFIPKASRFGNLQPSESTILENLIKENGGYLGGTSALNRAGVTTQIPAQVVIRGARSNRKLKIGNLTVQFFRQGNQDADAQCSKLTDILESIRLIKRTPDGNFKTTLSRVSQLLKKLAKKERNDLIDLVKNERPYVRAIIGALLEHLGMVRVQEIKDWNHSRTATQSR
jgi:hypothetical protein